MKVKSLHDLAVRLCEGGVVWFEGLSIVAKELSDGDDACRVCNLDCICNEPLKELCVKCDSLVGKCHYLELWTGNIKNRNKRG